MASYLASKGSRITNDDATILGRQFEELAKFGPVTPEETLDAARPVDAPTHRFYEWNNKVAGELYRLDQTRYYLRSVEIVIDTTDTEEEQESVRAFHVVTVAETEKRGYLHIDTIRNESALLAQVVETARRELVSWERRYHQYDSIKPLLTLVGQAIQQLSLPEAVAPEE